MMIEIKTTKEIVMERTKIDAQFIQVYHQYEKWISKESYDKEKKELITKLKDFQDKINDCDWCEDYQGLRDIIKELEGG